MRRVQAPVWVAACVLLLFALTGAAAQAPSSVWRVAPAYDSSAKSTRSTKLVIRDAAGQDRGIYSQSTAVLIMEGGYRTGGWQDVSYQAKTNETHLRSAFEARGYRVLVWRDLTGTQLNSVLEDLVPNLGYDPNGRLFIYYFGHGTVVGTPEDPGGPRGYLVPVNAPDPARDEPGFNRTAEPLSYLNAFVRQMTTKHVFVALEACRAGSIFGASLGEVPKTNPQGYLFATRLQENVRQFLTAGDASQDVPANGLFTGVLEEALDEADSNGDGYVTGTELMAYVAHNIPQRSATDSLNPEFGSVGRGDMIVGPVSNFRAPATRTAVPTIPSDADRPQVIVSARISGELTQQLVSVGTIVRKGQTLYMLDPRPAQIALVATEAQSRQHTQLLTAETATHDLLSQAVAKGSRSRDELDAETATLDRYQAMVERDKADVGQARLELGNTRGTAPLCGRVSRVFRSTGEHVDVGSPIMSIDRMTCPSGSSAAAAGASPSDASAKRDAAAQGAVVAPTRRRQPTKDEIERFYPDVGQAGRGGGKAVVTCEVSAAGFTYGCTLTLETPPDVGFGQAALGLAELIEFNPGTRNGAPYDGAVVNIPVNFAPLPPTQSPIVPASFRYKPTWLDVVADFPELAALKGKGAITLTCKLAENGTLYNCVARGFGSDDPKLVEGALKMSRIFRYNLPLKDGKPLIDTTITVPIIFGVPSGG